MRLISEDIACVKDKLYLFANNINLLYSIDVNTRMYEFIGQIPERSIFEKRLVSKIVHWNGELFLIPLVSGDIWIYSFGNKRWRKIKVKQYENNWANSYFRNAFIVEERLFILGGYYPAVLIIDLKSGKMEYLNAPFEVKNRTYKDLYFRGIPAHKNDCIYVASSIDNSLLKFNIKTYEYEWIEIGNAKNKYSGIVFDSSSMWLAPRNGNLPIIQRFMDGSVVEYATEEHSSKHDVYIGIAPCGDGFLIPATGSSTCSLYIEKDGNIKKQNRCYSFYKEIGDVVYSQDTNGNIYTYSNGCEKILCAGEISDQKFGNGMKSFSHYSGGTDGMLIENDAFSLKEWISMI